MGVDGFYPWAESTGFSPLPIYLDRNKDYIVDVKLFMYKYAYGVGTGAVDVAAGIARGIMNAARGFRHLTFVNDGKLKEDHPKQETLHERKEVREKAKQSVKRRFAELEEEIEAEKEWKKQQIAKQGQSEEEQDVDCQASEEIGMTLQEAEELELKQRGARGVSTEVSYQVLEILRQHGYHCIQCEEEEADSFIVKHAFEYNGGVLSDDSDLLVSGCDLIRGFGSMSCRLYKIDDILARAKITLRQLQEMACLAGCDYVKGGVRGIGMKTAHALIQRYKSLERMKVRMNPKERAKYTTFNDEFMKKANRALEIFSEERKNKINYKLECLKKIKTTCKEVVLSTTNQDVSTNETE